MAKRSKAVSLGSGTYTTKAGLKKAGTASHNFATSPSKGKRYTKQSHAGKSIKRSVRIGGARKSVSVSGKRLIVGSHAWNSSKHRRQR